MRLMIEIVTKSQIQTKKTARILAEEILSSSLEKKARVIGLSGELGAGKTTFIQGFAKGLKIKEKILSPTFVILKRFKIPNKRNFNFYHIDCYRLSRPKELLDLDFKEIINNPRNIVVIEWAEKVRKVLPKNTIWIEFDVVSEKQRKITVTFNFL